MNFSIRFRTAYAYSAPVTDNLNALRVQPATTSTQRLDEFHVRLDPESRLHRHTDYFGTDVIEFGIHTPHDHLEIDVRCRVVTSEPPYPPDARWDGLQDPAYRLAGGEFLLPFAEPADPATLDELLEPMRATSGPVAALNLLTELIPDRFAYEPGHTYVGSTIDDLFEAGAGVCQDFVHLALAMLRHQGLAGRYVSGYLFAPNGQGSENSAEVNTHAWIEALLPAADGSAPVWVAADPTNRTLSGSDHVKIGHGRAYSDVPPIRGVFRGNSRSEVDVSVTMTRLPEPAARPR